MRINLYAGPGAGKSTMASHIFSTLKRLDYNIELVSEFVKGWAITEKKINEFDQVYLMGKQLNYEYRFLSHGIDHIVTDSPVLLSACYTQHYFPNICVHSHMENIIMEYEKRHPAINIFLNRSDKKYKNIGRYESLSQALDIDNLLKNALIKNKLGYKEFPYNAHDEICNYIVENLDK